MSETKTIQSHRHSTGRFAREAWGAREDCKECTARDAQLKRGEYYGITPQPIPTPTKFTDGDQPAVWTDGEPVTTDRGIITNKNAPEYRWWDGDPLSHDTKIGLIWTGGAILVCCVLAVVVPGGK